MEGSLVNTNSIIFRVMLISMAALVLWTRLLLLRFVSTRQRPLPATVSDKQQQY